MALTPEDVVNKRFQTTKFREGYDQDEVDDFLDEIVVELRRLYQENDDLRRQVAEQGGSVAPAETAVPAPVSADGQESDATAVNEEPAVEEVSPEPVEEPVAEPAPAEPVAPASTEQPVAAPVAPSAAPAQTAPAAAGTGQATSAAGVLEMAQRLHDEYVADGERKRDEIISAAEKEADQLISEAKDTRRKTLDDLETKKSVLEREVEELRGFERDYRSRLRSYIEGQLQDLDAQGSAADK